MILVTGATGNVGGELVQLLCEAGEPTRALVRNPERADDLRGYDCEVVLGSFEDPDSLAEALRDIDAVFLLAPSDSRIVSREAAFARVAAEVSLPGGARPSVVKLGALGQRADSPVRLLRAHAESSAALAAAGLATTTLAPNVFIQNLFGAAGQVATTGELRSPVADASVSFIDVRDVASVAAVVLRDPAPHAGALYPLTGPEALPLTEVARQVSAAAGHEVRAVGDDVQGARERWQAAGEDDWEVEALEELYAWLREGSGAVVTDDVDHLSGSPARSLADFLADHPAIFRSV